MANKKKAKKQQYSIPEKHKLPLISLVVAILIVLFAYFYRGWFRATVIPKTTGIFYLSNVNTALDNQSNSLHNPLGALGFSQVTRSKICNLQQAQAFYTEVDCNVTLQSYMILPSNLNSEEKVAAHLQTNLENSGWAGGSNGVTLNSLIDGIARGIDYSPDANYEKIVGGRNDCIIDVMIAYANPQPPAIRGTFSCDRTVNVAGSPSGEFYNSSKGHI